MTERDSNMDWQKTTFDGSRREQLRRAQTMTVRQRLEAMDELATLSERMRAMPRPTDAGSAATVIGVHEPQTDYRTGKAVNEIVLASCKPTFLAGYIKGLGIIRLVAEQLDDSVRAYWKNGYLVLLSRVTREELKRFFLYTYTPTPIISPWSGRAGFLEGDAGDQSTRKGATTLRRVISSSGSRFHNYREIIKATREVSVITAFDKVRSEVKQLESLNKSKKLDKAGSERLSQAKKELEKLKDGLLVALRAELDDIFLQWIDACFVITEGEGAVAPLLGSGGNEGSMDFSINHVECLLDLIESDSDAPTALAEQMIGHALFDEPVHMDSYSNIGFLSVAAAGGANMSVGFDGAPKENLWNSVLVMEGAVLFAASATKKLQSSDKAGLSFPFTVQTTFAGDGSIGANEGARPEIWLPLWSSPASINELKFLFSEGRSTFGSRQAKSGLDMLEALSELGTDRGISAFERYGFFERRGKGYFVACHLGSYSAPREKTDSFIFKDLRQHHWLSRFSQFAGSGNGANRFRTLRRQLEDQLFDLSGREPTPAEMQSLIILLGDIQSALATKAMAVAKKDEKICPPVPRLSERWVMVADDGTPEFRIAKALAGLRGIGDVALPLRAQLFPVHPKTHEWMTPEYIGKRASTDAYCRVRTCIGQKGRLTATLCALLEHRLWLVDKLEMKDKPLSSRAGAALDDVAAFLRDDRMDARIAALLSGLSLCVIPEDTDRTAGEGALPAAFGLMKLAFTPDRILRDLGWLGAEERLPIPAGMLAQLAAGNHDNRAVKVAWRRLRAFSLTPFFADAIPKLGDIEPVRAAAALVIPLRSGATGALARGLLEEPETEADSVSIA